MKALGTPWPSATSRLYLYVLVLILILYGFKQVEHKRAMHAVLSLCLAKRRYSQIPVLGSPMDLLIVGPRLI